MKKSIKMIVTDLDDTLLRSEKYISDYTIEILKKCQSVGIKIVFATARSVQATSRYLEQFTPDILVSYGGALVVAGDTVIHRFDIPADISYQLISECLQATEISSIHAINESVALTNNLSDLAVSDSSHYREYDFSKRNNMSYLKISVVSFVPEVVERIAANYSMLDMLRYTNEDLYRFACHDAVKWNAVKAVAEYYDIDIDLFVAFGDDVNDIDMVHYCGIGVAVSNAVDAVKAVADDICDTNDNDGVAKWIEDNILL